MSLSLEDTCLAYRYLYYVTANSPISDYEYDKMEQAARVIAAKEHPIHGVGSSLPNSYSPEIIAYAESLVK